MPLSDSIAKGKLSAYQRWEMTSFEEPAAAAKTAAPAAKLAPTTLKELEQFKLAAQKEGFAKGFEEGHETGLKTGGQESQQAMQQELSAFLAISTQFNSSLQQAEHLVAQDILDLALDLAKAMLKSALNVNPQLIIPIVEQAITSLPSVQQPAQLFLNAKDAALVKAKIGEELSKTGWIVVIDAGMKAGDCRIETMRNQINANMHTRWRQLSEALGRDNSWYDPREPSDREH